MVKAYFFIVRSLLPEKKDVEYMKKLGWQNGA
jgi:hypothetical protein